MKYEIQIVFHEEDGLPERVIYTIQTDSYESAFKAALTIKDHDWSNRQLKDINVYNIE